MRTSRLAQLMHRGAVGFLVLSGVLMAVAMIPLILLLLAGMLLFSVTTRHTPRELTRRATLGVTSNGH